MFATIHKLGLYCNAGLLKFSQICMAIDLLDFQKSINCSFQYVYWPESKIFVCIKDLISKFSTMTRLRDEYQLYLTIWKEILRESEVVRIHSTLRNYITLRQVEFAADPSALKTRFLSLKNFRRTFEQLVTPPPGVNYVVFSALCISFIYFSKS